MTYTLSSGSGTSVAWSTANPAVATVDANGVVTGVTQGSTTVQAAVTTSGGVVNGSATVNVGSTGAGQASVTIQSVNNNVCSPVLGTCTSVPATLDSIAGQIDVVLNVEPGGQAISRVELVVTDVASGAETVCGTQNVTAAVIAAAQAEGAELVGEELAAAAFPITISCNTASLTAAGVPNFFNGAKQIRARLIGANGQTINAVTSTQNVTFRNQSQFVVSFVNNPTTPAALRPENGQAVGTNEGLLWYQGGLTITFTGANYVSGTGATFETLSGELVQVDAADPGPDVINFTGTKSATTNVFTATISGTNAAALALSEGAYVINVTGSTTTAGQVGPTQESGNTVVRIDNVDPVNTGNFDAALGTNFFINAAYPFAASNAALFDAPAAPADLGVGGTTVKFYAGLDAVVDAVTLPELSAAEIATLTEVTTGDQLAATLQNNIYGVIAVTYDRLGNHVAQRLGVNIGVDKMAPTGFAYSGATPDEGDMLTVAPTVGFDATDFEDDASGFGGEDVRVAISRVDENNTTAETAQCIIGDDDADCAPTDTANVTTYTPDENGYYTVTAALRDTAGNVSEFTTRTFLFDDEAPEFTGGLTIPNLLTPGQAYTFTPAITDDIDLDVAYLIARFAGAPYSIRYAEADLGAYGLPLTQSATPALTIASLPRTFQQVDVAGEAPAAPAAVGTGSAADIDNVSVRAYDVAGNSTAINQDVEQQNLAPAPAATNWAAASVGIDMFTITAPVDGFDVENDATINAGGAPETVTLVAEVLATGLDINNPFDQLTFWYVDALTNELVEIGAATATVTTNAANQRIFRYTFADWNPPASLGAGAAPTVQVDVVAVGRKGVNLLASQPITIDLVP